MLSIRKLFFLRVQEYSDFFLGSYIRFRSSHVWASACKQGLTQKQHREECLMGPTWPSSGFTHSSGPPLYLSFLRIIHHLFCFVFLVWKLDISHKRKLEGGIVIRFVIMICFFITQSYFLWLHYLQKVDVFFFLPLYWFSILPYTQMLELDLGHHNYAIITMIIFSCHWKLVQVLISLKTATDALFL